MLLNFKLIKQIKLHQKIHYYWDLKKEKTKSQFDLFSKFDLSIKNITKFYTITVKKKIEFMSTPFDIDAVNFKPLLECF